MSVLQLTLTMQAIPVLTSGGVVAETFILLETGDTILLEDGFKLELESSI